MRRDAAGGPDRPTGNGAGAARSHAAGLGRRALGLHARIQLIVSAERHPRADRVVRRIAAYGDESHQRRAAATACDDIDVLELLDKVRCPTLVFHCRNDAVVPFEEGRRVAASIPNAKFVPLESENHILLEDEPAWGTFLANIEHFLESTGSTIKRLPILRHARPIDARFRRQSDMPNLRVPA